MKIFNLPNDKEFYQTFKKDIEKAESVIIASPYLSGNIITYWREKMISEDKANFTIIYDIGNEQEGRAKWFRGKDR